MCNAAEVDEFREEALEAGRRDDLEDAAGILARVPEGVLFVAGFEDEIVGSGFEYFVAE